MNILNIAASIANTQMNSENIQVNIDVAFPVNLNELNPDTQNAIAKALSEQGATLDDLTAVELTIQQDEFHKDETPFGLWVHFKQGSDEWGGGFGIPTEFKGDSLKLESLYPISTLERV